MATPTNLAQYYSSKGQGLPSVQQRAPLYEQYGLGSASTYSGTAQQNTQLLGKLLGGGVTSAPAQSAPTTPSFQNTQQVSTYLNSFQSALAAPSGRMPSKTDINPTTGKQYAVNPSTGVWDDTYWAEVVEPGLKQQGFGDGVSTPSVEELRTQLLPKGEAPAPFSRVQEFETRREQMGVTDLETRLNDLKAQEDEAHAQLRVNVAGERGKPVAMGVIESRISEQTRMAQENLDFIGRQKSRVIDELNTANNVISLYVQLGGQDYEDAVNRYNDEFTKNLQVYDLWRGLRRDELDERQRQRDNARANLQIYATALMEGNLDYGSLGADQKLMLNRLEVQSGLPIGFTSNLHMSAKDRLLTVNEKTGEALVVGENGQMKVIQTGLRPTPKEATGAEKSEARFFSDAKSIQSVKVGKEEIGIFPQLVQRYAGDMSLSQIYAAYGQSDAGKAFGKPVEDPKDIADIYAKYK